MLVEGGKPFSKLEVQKAIHYKVTSEWSKKKKIRRLEVIRHVAL